MSGCYLHIDEHAIVELIISVIFLGPSGAQAIAADDLVEQCPSAGSESLCQPDLTMQQMGAVTLGRGNGKMLGK